MKTRSPRYWIVIDEDGDEADNVIYIDHEAGLKRCKSLNLAATKSNKYYRLSQKHTSRNRGD